MNNSRTGTGQTAPGANTTQTSARTLFDEATGSDATTAVTGRMRTSTDSITSSRWTEQINQRSFDDLGVALHEVTFCVFDVETTGGNRKLDEVTEIGAVKLRGGECLGTFQTMVNPGIAIPAEITILTGITQAMVVRAPKFDQVLPSFLEFIGDAVLVGHNVSFDMAFLQRCVESTDRPRLPNKVVDTLALARRLIIDEVPNLRLGTLADRLGLDHQPNHRALDDALATGDLLHMLLERAACFGVMGLDDLLALPKIDAHPQASKLKLTDGLPRTRGVYMFHDRDGRVLYVGKATNLRSRVRSYFSGDRRRKVAQLLRETDHLSHLECPGPLEADVTELRLIRQHRPRFNRVGTSRAAPVFVKVTLTERFPRLSIVTKRQDDGYYLGPITSRRQAKAVVEAIHSVTQLRRCTSGPVTRADCGPCATAQLGASACPCTGFTPATVYEQIVSTVVLELKAHPDRILSRLRNRMDALAVEERFEEAADTRDRAAALAAALGRQRVVERLELADRFEVELPGVGGAEISRGRLVRSWTEYGTAPLFGPSTSPVDSGDQARAADDELRCIASWLDANASELRLQDLDGVLSSKLPRLADFDARPSALSGPRRGRP
ncbi:MAG: DEDD exonuclease domain-containing protein [Actinobacteria bacterium]|nr:DEDD exonuclease domain-containing protein [Actinomycetota bacterium]